MSRDSSDVDVRAFYEPRTSSVQYVVADPRSRCCAIIDPVLDYDERSGATSTQSADALLSCVSEHDLALTWILDTHPHADHLSAADYLKQRTGVPTAIGDRIVEVQRLLEGNLQSAGQFPRRRFAVGPAVRQRRAVSNWRDRGRGDLLARSHARVGDIPRRRRRVCPRHIVHARRRDGPRRLSGRRRSAALAQHSAHFGAPRRHAAVHSHDYRPGGRPRPGKALSPTRNATMRTSARVSRRMIS